MSIFSVAVSLRSESVSLEDLTELVGMEPDRSHVKGERASKSPTVKRLHQENYWTKKSAFTGDSWTLDPHWPSIAPILETLAAKDLTGVRVTLGIGATTRPGFGYSFDFSPEHIALVSRAHGGIWMATYEANLIHSDRPDDYPYEGTLHPPGPAMRARRGFNRVMRRLNPFGKVRRHDKRAAAGLND